MNFGFDNEPVGELQAGSTERSIEDDSVSRSLSDDGYRALYCHDSRTHTNLDQVAPVTFFSFHKTSNNLCGFKRFRAVSARYDVDESYSSWCERATHLYVWKERLKLETGALQCNTGVVVFHRDSYRGGKGSIYNPRRLGLPDAITFKSLSSIEPSWCFETTTVE